MEGVPRIPMLYFPTRKSADTPAFRGKLQKFIAVQYGESPDSYSKEINELESLRAAAIHATHDYSGCATLKKYYCQLHFLKSRFPLTEGSPIAINFSWYDVFSDQVHSWSDIDFEVSCILFNVGALHSKVAGADSRTTVDDMKNCVTHYQCAAWAFEHLRSNFCKFFTPDVSSDLLGLMATICLAQAQECVVEKSLVDNRRSVITAKLLLQIVDYYQSSLKTVEPMLKDSSHHSDKMLKALRKWKKMIELKIAYYSSLTYLYRGQQAEDQKQYGERVSFYKAAQEKIEAAIKLSKTFERTDGVHETLNFVLDVVVGKATAAQKDNEFIYHEKVPAIDAISETIKGTAIVKPIPLKVDDSGSDIFARLVPIEAHEASSLYSEEKAKLLRSYDQKIEDKNVNLEKFLLAIGLDNLQVHEGESKVPQELVDCCAAMNGRPDAVKKLVELMGTLSGMFLDVDERLGDIKRIIEAQGTKDAEYGRVLGKLQPSNVFVELRHELEKYDKAHTLAKGSNETLREAVQAHVKNLRLLMKPLSELAKQIPAPAPIGEKEAEAVNEMKRLASKVDEMRKQRITLEAELRKAVQQDDITQTLVITQEEDVEGLFQKEISKHDKITQLIDQNLLAQENITRALTEANARYAGTKEVTMQVLAERKAFVQSLLTSYEAYDELVSKCNGGIGFYKKLDEGVGKLHAKVKGIAKVQDEEREAKLIAMRPALPPTFQPPSNLPYTPDPGMTGHPKLKDYLAFRKTNQKAVPSAPVLTLPSAPMQEKPGTNEGQSSQPNVYSAVGTYQNLPQSNGSYYPTPAKQTAYHPYGNQPNAQSASQYQNTVTSQANGTFFSAPVTQTPYHPYDVQSNQYHSGIRQYQSPATYSQATGSLFTAPSNAQNPQFQPNTAQTPIPQEQFVQQPTVNQFQPNFGQIPQANTQAIQRPTVNQPQPNTGQGPRPYEQPIQQPTAQFQNQFQQPTAAQTPQPYAQSMPHGTQNQFQPTSAQTSQAYVQPLQQPTANQFHQPSPAETPQPYAQPTHGTQNQLQPSPAQTPQPYAQPTHGTQNQLQPSPAQTPLPYEQQIQQPTQFHQPSSAQTPQPYEQPVRQTSETQFPVPGTAPNRQPYEQPLPQGHENRYTPTVHDRDPYPVQSIQSSFTTSQTLKYPEFISQANYTPKEPNYAAYVPHASVFQSYNTPPTQQPNAYYAYNNVRADTYTSYTQAPSQQQSSESETRRTDYPSMHAPTNQNSGMVPPLVQSKNLDLLTGLDFSAPPETPHLQPTSYQPTN